MRAKKKPKPAVKRKQVGKKATVPPVVAKGHEQVKKNLLQEAPLSSIIEEMQSKGLRSITLGGVTIEISDEKAPPQAASSQAGGESPETAARQGAVGDTSTDMAVRQDVALTQQMIDDPLGYEQSMIDAHTEADRLSGAQGASTPDRRAQPDL